MYKTPEERTVDSKEDIIDSMDDFIAKKFNERYGANESTQYWKEVTDLMEKIKKSRKSGDKKTTRENLEKLDSLTSDKVDE